VVETPPTRGSAADRKVILLRLLAGAEAERLGWAPTAGDIDAVTRWWCETFALTDTNRFARWLATSGLDWAGFREMMRQFAVVTHVLGQYADAIDAQIDAHLAIHTVHRFVAENLP
jgi:hypothetical protein